MKKIGEILKNARVDKNYSFEYLGRVTKIKPSFIESIEGEEWEKLPPLATILGFVKSIANILDINQDMAVAVLKRDYPPKKISVNPKPDINSKFSWGPKLSFVVGVALISMVVFGYLIFQYIKFVSPPTLSVDSPKDGQVVSGSSVLVFGATDTDAKITANKQPILVSDDGRFSASVDISKDTKEVDVVAVSRSGKVSEVKRKIEVQ